MMYTPSLSHTFSHGHLSTLKRKGMPSRQDLCTVGNTLRRLTEFDVTSCHAVKGHEGLLQLRLPPGCKLIF